MNGHSREPYQLPSELIAEVRSSARWLTDRSNHVSGGYLVREEFPVLRSEGLEIKNTDLLDFLSPVTQARAFDSAVSREQIAGRISFKERAGRVILKFVELFFDEIRKRICKTNKANFSIGKEMALALTSLAHWLAAHFDVVQEMAKVAASAVLVAIASATKGAFCRLTAKDALEALFAATQ